jgi:hypothetical protein
VAAICFSGLGARSDTSEWLYRRSTGGLPSFQPKFAFPYNLYIIFVFDWRLSPWAAAVSSAWQGMAGRWLDPGLGEVFCRNTVPTTA